MMQELSLRTPIWLKEALTIAVGVLGGLALFQATKKHIPGLPRG